MPTTLSQFFLKTAVYQGQGALAMVPDLLAGLGAKKAVLFSDSGIQKTGLVDKLARLFDLPSKGVTTTLVGVFTDIPQDAESSKINEGIRFVREKGADALVAIGGGSVLDFTKGVKYGLYKGAEDILDVIPGNFAFVPWPKAQLIPIPHLAIPTTAGTGAEVSPICVVYNEKQRVKANLLHPFVNADIAVLDPDVTLGLPKPLTASTAFDALTHAVEALFSPTAFAFTDGFALRATELIFRNLPKALENPKDVEARSELLAASAMGITAFTYALSAIPVHNLAHALGAQYRIPHGLANAVLLTRVMEAMPEFYERRARDLAKVLEVPLEGDGRKLLEASIEAIKGLRSRSGLPDTFKEFHIPNSELDAAVMAVMKDPSGVLFPIPEEAIRNIVSSVIG